MKARLGLILAAAALFSVSACAAGAGGSSAEAGAVPAFPGAQGEVLAEGIRPRDNAHTRAAENFLDEAMAAVEESEKTDFSNQALDAAMEGITADPENPKSYYQAALANINLKNYRAAAAMFDQAETLHPRYVLETELWRERGWVSAYNEGIIPQNSGDMESAAEIYEAANALYSKRPEALLQLGPVYSSLDRPDDAANALRTAMDMLEESKERALADTAQAPTWEQHWEFATTGFGQALQLSEQWQEAADFYGALVAENPEDAALIGSLASVLTELEMTDSVNALYENLLNRPGLTEFDYANAGVGLYRIGEFEQAARAFQSAVELNPFNRDARLNLVQTYFSAENWEPVIPAGRSLLELDPLNGMVWIFMTRAYSEMEMVEEANAVFAEYQALGYEVENIMLEGRQGGGATISGDFKNNTSEPGGTVTLRFHFGGEAGQEIGTIDIRVQIPAVEEVIQFNGDFRTSEFVTGYTYEVVG